MKKLLLLLTITLSLNIFSITMEEVQTCMATDQTDQTAFKEILEKFTENIRYSMLTKMLGSIDQIKNCKQLLQSNHLIINNVSNKLKFIKKTLREISPSQAYDDFGFPAFDCNTDNNIFDKRGLQT